MRWKWQKRERTVGGSPGQARSELSPSAPVVPTEREGQSRARIESDLEERGIATEWREALSEHLHRRSLALEEDAYTRMLDGAVLACEALAESRPAVDDDRRELREMERLLGAFSGELGKLDEILEVLAAYARRLRHETSAPANRLLH